MSEAATFCGRQLIAGRWVAASGKTFAACSPLTGEVLSGVFHHATVEEIDRAFEVAAAAHLTTRNLPPERWADFLEAIGRQIMALGQVLLDRAGAETALPVETRLVAERARTVNQLKLFAALTRESSWVDAVIDRPDPARRPLPKPDVRRMLRAIGPVAVFGPCNFPLAFGVCGGDTTSALAAGNPVVVKGHSNYPGTNELMARAVAAALKDTGMPAGLFSLLHGAGPEIGTAVVKHPTCQAVGFTGSEKVGRELLSAALSRPRPIAVYAEMGSLNPLVVLPGAVRERAEEIAAGLAG